MGAVNDAHAFGNVVDVIDENRALFGQLVDHETVVHDLFADVDGGAEVSSAMLTTSMARTTPAQKPRGLRRRTLLAATSDWEPLAGEDNRGLVTSTSIPCRPLSV